MAPFDEYSAMLGARIRFLRKRAGLSLRTFGMMIGVHHNSDPSYRTGEVEPVASNASAHCRRTRRAAFRPAPRTPRRGRQRLVLVLAARKACRKRSRRTRVRRNRLSRTRRRKRRRRPIPAALKRDLRNRPRLGNARMKFRSTQTFRRRTAAGVRGPKARRGPARAGCSCRSRTDDTSPAPDSAPSASASALRGYRWRMPRSGA